MPRKKPDRIVVVTGASNGPGRAIALEFALFGDALVLASRREGPLESVRRDCDALHAWTHAQVTDLSREDDAIALANAALSRFKRVDVWINYAPPVPLLRGDVTPADAFADGATFDLQGYENGAKAALACFEAIGGGVLINVDSLVGGAPPGYETEYAEARRRVAETFAGIEARARAVPGVCVTSVIPNRTPMASETLAPMIVSLARAQSRKGLAGKVLGEFERHRFHVWSRTVPPHRRGARPQVLMTGGQGSGSAGSAWSPVQEARSREKHRGGGTAVLDGGSSRRHGTWHLGHVAKEREKASTIAALIGLPILAIATALLLVI